MSFFLLLFFLPRQDLKIIVRGTGYRLAIKAMYKTFLKINDQFVDTSSLLRQRRADINTFAINAFLVSIRFAQFFKLSKELKFVWLGVKRSVNNVSRFSVYVILPCLLGSVSSAYIAFGSHIMVSVFLKNVNEVDKKLILQ